MSLTCLATAFHVCAFCSFPTSLVCVSSSVLSHRMVVVMVSIVRWVVPLYIALFSFRSIAHPVTLPVISLFFILTVVPPHLALYCAQPPLELCVVASRYTYLRLLLLQSRSRVGCSLPTSTALACLPHVCAPFRRLAFPPPCRVSSSTSTCSHST